MENSDVSKQVLSLFRMKVIYFFFYNPLKNGQSFTFWLFWNLWDLASPDLTQSFGNGAPQLQDLGALVRGLDCIEGSASRNSTTSMSQ